MLPKSSWLSALSLVSGSSWPGATFLEKTDSLFNFQQQLTDRGTDDSQMVSYSACTVWVCLPLLCHQCLLSLFWSLPSEQQTFQTEESSVASASLGYRQAKEGEIPSLPVEYQPLSVGLSGHRRVCLGTRVWSLHQNQEFIFWGKVKTQRHQVGTIFFLGVLCLCLCLTKHRVLSWKRDKVR